MKGLVHIYEGTGKGKLNGGGRSSQFHVQEMDFRWCILSFLKDGTTGEMNIYVKIPILQYWWEEHHFDFLFLMTPEEKSGGKGCLYAALFEKVKAAAGWSRMQDCWLWMRCWICVMQN